MAESFEYARDFVGPVRRRKEGHILANDLLGPVAIHLLRCPVPGKDRAIKALVENRIFGGLDNRSKLRSPLVGIFFSFRFLLCQTADQEGHHHKERQAHHVIASNHEGKSWWQQKEIRHRRGQKSCKYGRAEATYPGAERHGCEEECKWDLARRRQKLQQQRQQHETGRHSVSDIPARTPQVPVRLLKRCWHLVSHPVLLQPLQENIRMDRLGPQLKSVPFVLSLLYEIAGLGLP